MHSSSECAAVVAAAWRGLGTSTCATHLRTPAVHEEDLGVTAVWPMACRMLSASHPPVLSCCFGLAAMALSWQLHALRTAAAQGRLLTWLLPTTAHVAPGRQPLAGSKTAGCQYLNPLGQQCAMHLPL